MQQVVRFYFEFLDLNFAGSKVPIGTARTTPPTPFYKFSSRLGNSVQGTSTKSFSHLPQYKTVSKRVTFQEKEFSDTKIGTTQTNT